MEFSSESKYSFTVEEINSGKIFYFTLDSKNQPLKLGDGSFGVVFQGYDQSKNVYAIKLLYAFPDRPIAKSRFEAEINSTKNIRENLDDKTQFVGVIEPVGATRQFLQSKAYNTLKDIFEPLGVSGYALVMPKFEETLKELLEKRIGSYYLEDSNPINSLPRKTSPKENKNYLEEKSYELRGYDILRRMSFEDRIADILPYLQDVAQGLKTLHQANYYHLDLKPANIFVRKLGLDVQSVIGDLGFLEQGDSSPLPVELGTNESLPLGTRHYRSPEQKDYFDIADVEISPDEERTLIVRDLNFEIRSLKRKIMLFLVKTEAYPM